MKAASMHHNSTYLDISEFILKEHSPHFRPKLPEHGQVIFYSNILEFHFKEENYYLQSPSVCLCFFCQQSIQILEQFHKTPELSPKIQGTFSFAMTPLMRRGTQIGVSVLEREEMEDLDAFCLEEPAEEKPDFRNKKITKQKSRPRPRLESTWHYYNDDLLKIIQENVNQHQNEQEQMQSQDTESQLEQQISSDEEDSEKFLDEEKQSTANFELVVPETISLEWTVPNPKKELLTKLKSVSTFEQLPSDEQKIRKFKQVIQAYIFQHEQFYFDETMNQLKGSVPSILSMLCKGIEQTFKRTIGGLAFEKRRLKLLKYMEKKNRRIWKKKVNYDCRKKVADGRLRIKGKFVTIDQACQQLSMASLEGYTADEIKGMLEKRS